MEIKFTLNGSSRTFQTSEDETLFSLLKRNGIRSVRDGCSGEGSCGSCAILLDGKLVNSCLLKTPQVDGKEILTVEGLARDRELDPVQKAFIESGIVQCGYCTPSQILAVKELLNRTQSPTEYEVKDALSGSLCRCTGYQQIFDAVASLTKVKKSNTASFRKDLRIIGKYAPKSDSEQLVRAEAAYVEDHVTPDSLILKILRSPHAHAKIRRIDTSRAEALKGVELVLTHMNVPAKRYNTAGQGFPEPSPYDRRLIDDTVRFVGDRVAVIAAEDEKTAYRALSLIEVEYEVLDAVPDIESASAENAPQVHTKADCFHQFDIGADLKKNIAASNSGSIGDIEKGFKEADTVIEREYTTSRVQCTPVEPHAAFTEIKNGRLIVHTPTQVPYHIRRILAGILEIPENKIRVIKEKIGGGFGSKQDMVLEEIPAWISWATGKPAYIRFSRQEEFLTRPRYPMKIKVKAGAKKDGTLTAVDLRLQAAAGAYGPHCLTVPMNSCSKSLPIFKCPNMSYDVKVYYTNNTPSGAYQGYGAPQGTYALQTIMAELASELNMDHIDFLKKNAVEKGYRLEILRCLGEGQEGIPQEVSSSGIHKALEKGSKMIEWPKKNKSASDNILIGKGAAIVQQGSGLPGIDSANAAIKMLGDGTFMVLFGGTDLGTGLDTVVAKIAAEILCIDLDSVSVTAADTDTTPFDVGSYASSGTYFSGMSVYRAAVNMKQLILKAAADITGADISGLRLDHPGIVRYSKNSLKYSDLAHKTQSGTGSGQMISTGSFTTKEAPIPYGAHFVEVSVNKKTGRVHINKYYALHDCGTPVNPLLAAGQIYGGVMKSIGHSLYEDLKFDDRGRCLNASFTDYKVPMIWELPDDFQAELVYTEDPLGPFGAKSIGEVVTNGAAPALASAIHDATGVWMRSWPFTPEKLLKELEELQIC
ncbi:MAG: molybdopterin cofactor-binding domain-containing protein [Elusimicrobiota bacterium]